MPKVDGPQLQGEPRRVDGFLLRHAETGLQELGDFLLAPGLGFEADKQCVLDHCC